MNEISQTELNELLNAHQIWVTSPVDWSKPYRTKYEGIELDLHQLRIQNAVFDDLTFDCGGVRECEFIDCTFKACHLGWTLLSSNMVGCIFTNCTTRKESWDDCNLTDCRFEQCEFLKGDFWECNLTRISFDDCRLFWQGFYTGSWQQVTFNKTQWRRNSLDEMQITSLTIAPSCTLEFVDIAKINYMENVTFHEADGSSQVLTGPAAADYLRSLQAR